MEEYSATWRASPVHHVFVLLGTLLAGRRLHPGIAADIGPYLDGAIPDHVVTIRHISGKTIGRRKGYYEIQIEGPKLSGGWYFSSGQLEKLANLATHADSNPANITPAPVAHS
jgi:hypothetical protein